VLGEAASRGLVYGITGSAVESLFTTLLSPWREGRLRVRGPSTPWMLPIYGLALPLFEPVHEALRGRPAVVRGAAYATGVFAVEAVSGWALRRRTGHCPWDYSGRSRFSVRGLIRLDYAPLWAALGLATERLHDALSEGPSSPRQVQSRFVGR
jgi:Putative ABC-transporter type IV